MSFNSFFTRTQLHSILSRGARLLSASSFRPKECGHFKPLTGTDVPRFADVATLMRLPMLHPAHLEENLVDIALVGVPWDGGTTNRPGARLGPRQVRDVSTMVRNVNRATGVNPFDLCRCVDAGDSPVNPGDLQDCMHRITSFYSSLMAQRVVPLSCGGDHLSSLPILRALAKDGPLGMVHFDAHSDMWDQYFDGTRFTHGTVFRRAIEENLLDPTRIVQIGIRGALYADAPDSWGDEQGVTVLDMERCHELGAEGIRRIIHEVVGTAPTYVSFDIDVLDPAYAPGTGTPEVGGFTTAEALRLIRGLGQRPKALGTPGAAAAAAAVGMVGSFEDGLNIVGADVVEVAPPYDPTSNTSLAACTIMYELLCVMAQSVSVRKNEVKLL